MEKAKKFVFYFNAIALSYSYFFLSLLLVPSALSCAPEGLRQFFGTILTPIEFIFDAVDSLANEYSGGIAYIIALLLSVIIPILTYIFLRNELSRRTFLLLSLSFILPLGLLFTAILGDSALAGYDLLSYIIYSIYIIGFLAYGIITLVFMFKDINELDL